VLDLSGLKKSFFDLDTFTSTTTRQLDETYYSILEKLSLLQGTVVAMQALAGMSREVSDSFSQEARDLVADAETQLEGLGGFDDQQKRITSLQGRISGGRERIVALSRRVDAVNDRIDSWERADREWQDRTRRRLKVIWLVMIVIVFVVLTLVFTAQYAPGGLEQATVRFANESIAKLRDASGRETNASWGSGEDSHGDSLQNLFNNTRSGSQEGDRVLRAFDEL